MILVHACMHPIATQPVQKQDCQEALIENTNYFSNKIVIINNYFIGGVPHLNTIAACMCGSFIRK